MADVWERYIDEDSAGKDVEISDLKGMGQKEIDTYVAGTFQSYGEKYYDEELWDAFKVDFEDWGQEAWKSINKQLRTEVCNHLQLHGIYLGEIANNVIRLTNALKEEEMPRYPEEKALEKADKYPDTFRSMSNPHWKELLRKRIEVMNTMPFVSSRPQTPTGKDNEVILPLRLNEPAGEKKGKETGEQQTSQTQPLQTQPAPQPATQPILQLFSQPAAQPIQQPARPVQNDFVPIPATETSFQQAEGIFAPDYRQNAEQRSVRRPSLIPGPGAPIAGTPDPRMALPTQDPRDLNDPNPPQQQRYSDQQSNQWQSTRALTDLVKMYHYTQKFAGDKYEILDEYLKVFKDMCLKAGVGEDRYADAYSVMLSGRALKYYFDYLADKKLPFKEMVARTKSFFHTVENQQMYMNEWRSTSIHRIINENPESSLAECLEKLIEQVQRIHKGLSINYKEDINLKEGMISAVQGHPAFTVVIMRPALTFDSVCSDLRSAAGNADRCKQHAMQNNTTGYDQHNYDQFWTDRTYGGNRNRGGFRGGPRGGFRPRGGNQSGRRWNRRDDNNRRGGNPRKGKKCFVCGKQGCWSTKHSTGERKAKRGEWRQYAQDQGFEDTNEEYSAFLLDYEGIDVGEPESEEMEDFDMWLSHQNDGDDDDACGSQESTQYLTTYGEIDGQRVADILANQATEHAFTGLDLFKDPIGQMGATTGKPDDRPPTMFYLDDRYLHEFQGIMPDTGASGISTGGEPQMRALQRTHPHITMDTTTAGRCTVRFGDNELVRSVGTTHIHTPFGTIAFQIMPTNTPFLLCLKDMDKLGVYLNNLRNVLTHGKKDYPVVRKFGHTFFLLDSKEVTMAYCHLTEKELRQIHRRFGHPAADRLYQVLDRAGYNDLDRSTIEKIGKYCHQCQLHGSAPGRFKFTIKDDIDFNHSIYVDVMYLKGKPVLHVLDKATTYQAAKFMRDMTAKHTWDTLRFLWIDTYLGPPDNLVFDAGTNFTANEFVANAKSMSITVEEVPVEAHNSIGQLERYHGPLRRAYEVISEDLKGEHLDPSYVLQMAVKAVNDTAGPDGLVPTLLVFGAYPRLVDSSPPMPSLEARAAAIKKAMNEVYKLKAKRQVADALGMRNGPNVLETMNLPLQSEVRVYRENKGWTGPYKLLARNENTCTVEVNERPVDFRITSVKPYFRDENTNIPNDGDDNDSDTEQDEPDEYIPEPEGTAKRGRGRPRGSRNKPKDAALYEEMCEEIAEYEAFMTMSPDEYEAFISRKEMADQKLSLQLRKEGKITTPGQPFEQSDAQEIEGLIGRGVFSFEKYDKKKHDGIRIFNSRMVREIKGKTTESPYEKSRLIIQGYNDEDKKMVLTQSPTIQRSSQRIIAALAPSLIEKEMTVWLRDVTQAYTQSKTPLNRRIIARLPSELIHRYPEGTLMVVVKPIYGVPEAGTHWWATYFKHHKERLGMITSTYDPCLLISEAKDKFGIVGMQTDDTLGVSDKAFDQMEDEELRKAKILAKPKTYLTKDEPLMFNGCVLSKGTNDNVDITQKGQGKKIEMIQVNAKDAAQQYVQQRARGAYIASICQPEATFDMSEAAQHVEPGKMEIERLNKRLGWQKDNLRRGLRSIKLDLQKLKIFVFVDGSFANNRDLSSQIGYLIFVANEVETEGSFTMDGNLVHWSSTKCKRVTRSVLASEIYAMIHGVDMGIAIGTTITLILDKLSLPEAPIVVCTDSFSLYECLVKLGTTKEKRLMIDIMSLRQSYERREIGDVRWIHGEDNPADAMTKSNANKALKTFIETNRLTPRLQGWVKRN
ncbi:hypothetical protein ABKA04_007879 [Annulohypoxylon sp. FPYF3050]